MPIRGYCNYHEPFLGGGAVYFSLQPKEISYLSDSNSELISTYRTIKDHVQGVIAELLTYDDSPEFYYTIRARGAENKIAAAARFIYLNQTSFNGIYRVNLKGEYNVPYGYRNMDFVNSENLMFVSEVLQNAVLNCIDFSESMRFVKKADLVFLDPPYTVAHNKNGFIKYNQKLFSVKAKRRLLLKYCIQ